MAKASENKNWQPTLAEVIFAVLLVIIPWTFPTMGIIARCVLWFVAWLLILRLVFSLVPSFRCLPLAIRVTSVLVLTAVGSIAAYYPVVDAWREEMASAVTGKLRPDPGEPSDEVKFQFGPNAKALIKWTGGADVAQFDNLGSYIKFSRDDRGQLVVNTVIRDREGHMLVEIVDNEWRVSAAAWEKNYTRDALEVKDGDGKIVFQLRVFPDRAEIQAEWWNKEGQGMRVVQIPDPHGSNQMAAEFVQLTPASHPEEPAIQPIFRYPSKKYFGQLR